MNNQRKEYYEKLKANKKRLEDKQNLEVVERCALNEINRRLTELNSESFFEDVTNNNGRTSKKNDLENFIAKQ